MPATTNSPSRIDLVSPHALRPYPRNARVHSKRQINQIAESIRRFGFTNPVLVSDEGEIIAGHGRVLAARKLGMDQVPTIRISHLSAAERRAYVLADNKLALNAGWDTDVLAIELQGLIDLDFDLSITGFSLAEIDLTLDGAQESAMQERAPEDETPTVLSKRCPGRAISGTSGTIAFSAVTRRWLAMSASSLQESKPISSRYDGSRRH